MSFQESKGHIRPLVGSGKKGMCVSILGPGEEMNNRSVKVVREEAEKRI
jgi:hypothetical protein